MYYLLSPQTIPNRTETGERRESIRFPDLLRRRICGGLFREGDVKLEHPAVRACAELSALMHTPASLKQSYDRFVISIAFYYLYFYFISSITLE